MKRFQGFVLGFIMCAVMIGSVSAIQQYTAQQATFDVYVNGEPIDDWGDVPPLVVDGRTMLPLASLGETLDVEIHWDGEHRRVIVKNKEGDIVEEETMTKEEIETTAEQQEDETNIELKEVKEVKIFVTDSRLNFNKRELQRTTKTIFIGNDLYVHRFGISEIPHVSYNGFADYFAYRFAGDRLNIYKEGSTHVINNVEFQGIQVISQEGYYIPTNIIEEHFGIEFELKGDELYVTLP